MESKLVGHANEYLNVLVSERNLSDVRQRRELFRYLSAALDSEMAALLIRDNLEGSGRLYAPYGFQYTSENLRNKRSLEPLHLPERSSIGNIKGPCVATGGVSEIPIDASFRNAGIRSLLAVPFPQISGTNGSAKTLIVCHTKAVRAPLRPHFDQGSVTFAQVVVNNLALIGLGKLPPHLLPTLSCTAYLAERDVLLRRFEGKHAAYHQGRRTAIGEDKESAVAETRRRLHVAPTFTSEITAELGPDQFWMNRIEADKRIEEALRKCNGAISDFASPSLAKKREAFVQLRQALATLWKWRACREEEFGDIVNALQVQFVEIGPSDISEEQLDALRYIVNMIAESPKLVEEDVHLSASFLLKAGFNMLRGIE